MSEELLHRFTNQCETKCIERKVVLENLNLGPFTAMELRNILNEGKCDISTLKLKTNIIGDKGLKYISEHLDAEVVETLKDSIFEEAGLEL